MKHCLKNCLTGAAFCLALIHTSAIAQITVDVNAPSSQQAGLDRAQNGVPIVNITAPNAGGLSHNKFLNYNVGANGLVINNLNTTQGVSVLGGAMLGNPNLQNRAPASVILNEVTGTSLTSLLGFTEIFGTPAALVISNPNGIVVNGAGFLNTPRVTLTTGTPLFSGGLLQGFNVNQGNVRIEGLGLNATGVDYFDILSRTAEVAAQINSDGHLRIGTGRNQVNYEDLSLTALADDGSAKPTVGIDSTALGGMYAGRITLIANEKGVGVNLAGETSTSVENFFLKAQGDVNVRKVGAKGSASVQSVEGKVNVSERIHAGGDLSIAAATKTAIMTNAVAAAAGNTGLEADQVEIAQGAMVGSGITASGNFRDTAHHTTIIGTSSIDNFGTISATGNSNLTTSALFSRGNILARQNHYFTSGSTLIDEGATVSAGAGIDAFTIGSFTNRGTIVSDQFINIDAGTWLQTAAGDLSSVDVGIASVGTMTLAGATTASNSLILNAGTTLTNSGEVISDELADISFNTLNNTGRIYADSDLYLTGIDVNNQAGGYLSGKGWFDVYLANQLNNAGTMENSGQFFVRANSLINQGSGQINALGYFTIDPLATFTNSGRIELSRGAELETSGLLSNSGTIQSSSNLTLRSTGGAVAMTSTSGITADGNFVASAATDLTQAGALESGQNMELTAGANLINSGVSKAGGTLLAVATTSLTNSGEMTSQGILRVRSAALDNSNLLASASDLFTEVSGNFTNTGTTLSLGNTTHGVNGILTNRGNILGEGDIHIAALDPTTRATAFYNESGAVVETWNGDIVIRAQTLVNRTAPPVITRGVLVNTPAWVQSGNTRYLEYIYDDQSTDIISPAKIRAGRDITLDGGTIRNEYSQITANRNLTVTGGDLYNQGETLTRRTQRIYQNYVVVGHNDDCGFEEKNCTPSPRYGWVTGSETNNYSTIRTVKATIEAGGTLTANLTGLVSTAQTTAAIAARSANFAVGGASITNLQDQLANPLALTLSPNPLDAIGSLGQLFTFNNDPAAKYLIETRSEFIDLTRFLGSDYFFDRIPHHEDNHEVLIKRLGDAYFETNYVNEQIFNLTGNRYLNDDFDSDYEQMQHLLDNALIAMQSLNLTPGIALTAEQFNNLQSDIVWMVEKEVNGQRVLEPVVYLTALTAADITSSGTITADRIRVEAAAVANGGTIASTDGSLVVSAKTGDIENTGTLSSTGVLIANAARDMVNRGGSIEGANILIAAGRDILNEAVERGETGAYGSTTTVKSAAIEAASMLIMNAGRNINVQGSDIIAGTAAPVQEISVPASLSVSDLYEPASLVASLNLNLIDALSAPADLELPAARFDTNSASGQSGVETAPVAINATLSAPVVLPDPFDGFGDYFAGGQSGVSMTAGNAITITTVAMDSAFSSSGQGWSNTTTSTRQVGSNIVTTNLSMVSGVGGVDVTGSNLLATEAAMIRTSGDVTFSAAENSFSSDTAWSSKSSGLFSSRSRGTMSESSTWLSETEFSAGTIDIVSGRDVSVTAFDISAAGDIAIQAVGDITIGSGTQTQSMSQTQNSKSLLAKANSSSTYDATSQVRSALGSGGNLTLTAGGDTTVSSSDLFALVNLTINTGGDLNFTTVADTVNQTSHSSSSGWDFSAGQMNGGFGVSATHTDTNSNSTYDHLLYTGSTATAGGNLLITAGGDASFTSAVLGAGGDAAIVARGNLLFDTAVNEVHSTSNYESTSIGVSVALSGGTIAQVASGAALLANGGGEAGGVGMAAGAYRLADAALSGYETAGVRIGVDFSTTTESSSSDYSFGSATTVNAGGDLILTSGGDFTSVGGKFSSGTDSGDNIYLNVGGDAVFTHFIDTLEENFEPSTIGVSVSATFGAGTSVSGSGHYSGASSTLDQGTAVNTSFTSGGTLIQNITGTTTRDDGTNWLSQTSDDFGIVIPEISTETIAMAGEILGNLDKIGGVAANGWAADNWGDAFQNGLGSAGNALFGESGDGSGIFDLLGEDGYLGRTLLYGTEQQLASLGEDALTTALSAFADTIVGHGPFADELWYGNGTLGTSGKILTHAAVDGLVSDAMGGRFSAGAVSGLFAATTSEVLYSMGYGGTTPYSAEYNAAQSDRASGFITTMATWGDMLGGGDGSFGALTGGSVWKYNDMKHLVQELIVQNLTPAEIDAKLAQLAAAGELNEQEILLIRQALLSGDTTFELPAGSMQLSGLSKIFSHVFPLADLGLFPDQEAINSWNAIIREANRPTLLDITDQGLVYSSSIDDKYAENVGIYASRYGVLLYPTFSENPTLPLPDSISFQQSNSIRISNERAQNVLGQYSLLGDQQIIMGPGIGGSDLIVTPEEVMDHYGFNGWNQASLQIINLRNQYPGSTDEEIAVIESARLNIKRASSALAQSGLLPQDEITRLTLPWLFNGSLATLEGVSAASIPLGAGSSLFRTGSILADGIGEATYRFQIGSPSRSGVDLPVERSFNFDRELESGSESYLFRGSVLDFDGRHGVSFATTDPGVAIQYAIQTQREYGGTGVLHIIPESRVSDRIFTQPYALPHDLEKIIDLPPAEIPGLAQWSLSINEASSYLRNANIDFNPSVFDASSLNDSLRFRFQSGASANPTQISDFIKNLSINK